MHGQEREVIELLDQLGRRGWQFDGSEGRAQPTVEFPCHR
jgi:hypothetical protein